MLARPCRAFTILVLCLTGVTTTAGALTQGTWRPYTNPNVLVRLGMSLSCGCEIGSDTGRRFLPMAHVFALRQTPIN
jgi:hypothetical protein